MVSKIQEGAEYWYDIIGVMVLLVATVSIIGNIGILVLYKRVFKRRKSRLLNVNLISLTCSDIGICVSFPIVIDACFNHGWRLGMTFCRGIAYSDAIFAYSQIYNLAAIALERYAVSKKTQAPSPSKRKKIISISIVWFLAILMASLPMFGFGGFMQDGINVSCTFDYEDTSTKNILYVCTISLLGFIAPVTIICVCYYKIINIYKQSASKFTTHRPDERSQALMRRREFLLVKSASKAVISFSLAWTPYAIIALSSVFGHRAPALLQSLASIFAKSSSATNAIVYICNHPEFKEFKNSKKLTEMDQLRTIDATQSEYKVDGEGEETSRRLAPSAY